MKYLYIIVIALAFASCKSNNNAPQKSNKNNADSLAQVITTTTVKERPMNDELLLNGNISCDESLMGKVFIPCTGRVNGVHVEVGDHVARGQVLAVVHSTEAAENTQDLSDARAQLRVALRELRMKKDMQASGMASDKDVAEARAQVSLLKAQLNRLAVVSGINNYHQGSNAILRSPISGFIINKSVYNDSYVDESSNDTPAFEIADISRVWVIADVYESDIAKVHQGSNVYVTTMAYPDKIFTGKINKIYSMIDEDSKTMKVCITLDNIQMGKILTTFTEATTKLDIIEDFSIIAKEDLLLIALRNLINNARKYSNGKGITITVDRPTIRIEDQGIGIPQTDLKHIFEPFYRAANATSISGHGIGLALAKQILEKSDAKISVTSIEGQGTEFKIRFKRTITAIHQAQHLTKV